MGITQDNDAYFCTCFWAVTPEDQQVCTLVCMAASGAFHGQFHRAIRQAEQLGITSELLQRVYAAGFVAAIKHTLASKK